MARRIQQRFPSHSIAHRFRFRSALGPGTRGKPAKTFYLQAHTDFVYSVIGEEMGLLGALAVLALFGIILMRGLRLTSKIEEPFEQYLAFGLTVLLGMQGLIHMGVVMGLMPTKGLVLPFISYGGSAIVVNLAGWDYCWDSRAGDYRCALFGRRGNRRSSVPGAGGSCGVSTT